MQRVLVIAAVIVLVVASIGVGALTANWPFWRRAWAWHAADGNWPSALPGPHAIVRGDGGAPLEFANAMDDVRAVAASARTQLLLRVRGGGADAWVASGSSTDEIIDGHGLAPVMLAALFAQLEQQHPGLLDQPAGRWIDAWRQDARGATTPRQLLAQLEGGIGAPYAFAPLNPFSEAAQLAAGPDFHRAGIALYDTREPGSTDITQAAAAQVLAGIATAAGNSPFHVVLERELWSTLAASDAILMLDRRRGTAASHCCLQATAADWLRLALRLATHRAAKDAGHTLVMGTGGRVLVAGPGPAALLWVGEGDPPSGLETLLAGPDTGRAAAEPAPVQ
jgi:hypothetical protein